MNNFVALYARTSTSTQEKGLEAQIHALRIYCEVHQIKNYQIFADEGVSGTKESRPELDRLMSEV